MLNKKDEITKARRVKITLIVNPCLIIFKRTANQLGGIES
jgi:hypothetical protein